MIQLYHVFKQYDTGRPALADLSLNIEKGEFVFLTGPSGAGKTTLLRLIFREEIPTKGHVLVGGRNITVLKDSKIPLLRRSIGVVFQDFKLIERKTVLENVAFVHEVMARSRREARRRAWASLRQVGLDHKLNEYPRRLSGGEKQRVAIARALTNDPLILLADEPTGNLDHELSLEIIKLFKRVNAQGTTVLVATHDRQLLSEINARVVGLEKGRLTDPRQLEITRETR